MELFWIKIQWISGIYDSADLSSFFMNLFLCFYLNLSLVHFKSRILISLISWIFSVAVLHFDARMLQRDEIKGFDKIKKFRYKSLVFMDTED